MKEISNAEKSWLDVRFPDLRLTKDEGAACMQGDLVVDMFYDENSLDNKYVIFPKKEFRSSNKYIRDVYQIKIVYCEDRFIPKVYETNRRIKLFAQENNFKLCDLHVNPLEDLCLCPKSLERIKLREAYTIQDFFTVLLIPFFYAQSFFEKYNDWPWEDYSHGDMGLLEAYVDYSEYTTTKGNFFKNTYITLNPKIQSVVTSQDSITRQSSCLCDSGRRFRKCHPKAWNGVKRLRRDYIENFKHLIVTK